jgi:hypothetical protein
MNLSIIDMNHPIYDKQLTYELLSFEELPLVLTALDTLKTTFPSSAPLRTRLDIPFFFSPTLCSMCFIF